MKKITITTYKNGDEWVISDIILRCLYEINSKDLTQEQLENIVNLYSPELVIIYSHDITSPIFVAKIDWKIVGTVTISENRIRSFFVDPDMHGCGIWKSLITNAERFIKDRNYTFSYLGSSIYAVPFYEKQWYTLLWEMIDPKVWKLIKMQKYF